MNKKKHSFRWRSWKVIVPAIYIVLLLASHAWRVLHPYQPILEPDQQTQTVGIVSGDTVETERLINIAYRDTYGGTDPNPPVVLLLHGSPVGIPMLPDLISRLSRKVRVIAPDFPGYDGSAYTIPNYSMRAYSIYMKQLLDSLDITEAHIVGYSLGGAVAINMGEYYPEKVESIDLLSGMGVQEYELMGSYHLNHAIHGAQLAFIWMVHEGIPHFGLLDDFPLNKAYARSFYDSDQRPIREYLKNYRKPMLIQHGDSDGLVPLAAAQEHYRIVPQSRIILYEGGHILVITENQKIANDITDFVTEVEAGTAATYADALEIRKQFANQKNNKNNLAKVEGLTLFVLMIIIILSTLISEDLTCIGAGLLAARGIIGFWAATTACFLGIFIGDVGLYVIGWFLGRPAVRRAPVKWILSESDLERSSDWFEARGPAIIIASRFIPGSRLPTYFSAGVIRAGFLKFIFYFIIAAIVWTPLLVGTSMLVGSRLMYYFEVYQDYAIWILLGIVLLIYGLVKFVFPIFTWKGRKLIISRWKRLANWEFWSPFIIYAPVLIYVFLIAIKFRSLTVCTAANPAIPDGGFIGESKSEIMEQFAGTGHIPVFSLIKGEMDLGQRVRAAHAFIQQHDLRFPVVIKPDVGQRGNGVFIPHDEKELKSALETIKRDTIIQKYVAGSEFGVFYYRFPGNSRGQIFSITDKRLISLTGDGTHTLEELILLDRRAICLAPYHLEQHGDELYDIPKAGEKIQLVDVGTHARGALFLDGSHLITPELRDLLDHISREAGGYFFGRFDIRVPSEDHLKNGEDISIIEINGVTSEATSIYDPGNSFLDAQKTLMKQWRIAYDIGEANRRRGVKPSSLVSLIKKLVTFKPI